MAAGDIFASFRGSEDKPYYPLQSPCQQDFIVIVYNWNSGNGIDLDTQTCLIDVDSRDVGWSHESAISGVAGDYLVWAADNITDGGPESVLVNLANIRDDFPDLLTARVRLRALWFDTKLDGHISVTLSRYRGGSMTQDDDAHTFTNSGGELIDVQTINTTITLQDGSDPAPDGQDIQTVKLK